MEKRLIYMFRSWLWLFALSAMLAGTTTYLLLKDRPTIYEAHAKLIIGPGIDTPDPDLNALRAGGQLMQTYAEISRTSPFLQSIIDELELSLNTLDLRRIIEVSTNQETQILSLTVTHRDAGRAIAIANLGAEKLVQLSPSGPESSSSLLKEQMRMQAARIEQVISESEVKIQKLESDLQSIAQADNQGVVILQTDNYLEQQRLIIEQLSQERARLTESLTALTVLYESLQRTTTNQAKIIEPAVVAIPIPAYLWLKVVIGALAGLVLAGAFVFSIAYFDESIWTHEELERVPGADILGVVAEHKRLRGASGERLVTSVLQDNKAAESYHWISTKLMLASEGNLLETLLLSNMGEELDGETGLITANLAITLAKSGKKVALIDSNSHNPVVTELFDLHGRAGLSNFLIGEEETFSLVQIDWTPNLFVLPHGTESNAPAESYSSTRMIDLIEKIKDDADIVLIGASSLLTYIDSHILATRVDGVILIAQRGAVRSRNARELIDGLLAIKANIAGVIFDYNRPNASLNLFDRLARRSQPQSRSLEINIRDAFRDRVNLRLRKIDRVADETSSPGSNSAGGNSGSAYHKQTKKHRLENEAFPIRPQKY